jgi:hypothetical protein
MVPIEDVERIRAECVAPILRKLDRIERDAEERFPHEVKAREALRARFDVIRAALEQRLTDLLRPH